MKFRDTIQVVVETHYRFINIIEILKDGSSKVYRPDTGEFGTVDAGNTSYLLDQLSEKERLSIPGFRPAAKASEESKLMAWLKPDDKSTHAASG